jgi:hypothetical protein
LIKYAIDGAVAQVQRAYDIASGKGAININVLVGDGRRAARAARRSRTTKGLVDGRHLRRRHALQAERDRGVYGVSYLPIISSARAFSALWKRATQGGRMARRGGL